MTIERKGRFLEDHDLKGHLSIGIESRMLKACVAEANRRRAYGVFGSGNFHFREHNLDFLPDLPRMRKVFFFEDLALKNIDGIYSLKELCDFTMNFPKRPGIEFDRLKKLDFAQWYYNEKDTGLGSLKHLRDVGLSHYNPKHKSFEGLDLPDSIENLGISWANPKSLVGLPVLPRLKEFQMARCRNIESIAELPRIAPNVESLDIESCGRLADVCEVVRQLPNLRRAFLDNEEIACRPARPSRLMKKD